MLELSMVSKVHVSLLGALAAVMLLSACSPSVKVRSDTAPDVDLSKYQTYGFFNPMGVEDENYSSLLGQHFRGAIDQQMSVRGFSQSGQPQLQLNVSIGAQDKVRVNTYSDPYLYGGYHGYHGYGYYGGPWYGGGTRTTVTEYVEANVYVDVVDAAAHKLVWQGVATFTLTDKMQQNMRETVNNTVSEIFTQFPVPAPAAGD
jgi:hypothetical protein